MTVVGPSMSTNVTEENVNDAMAKLLQQGGFGVSAENGYTPPAPETVANPVAKMLWEQLQATQAESQSLLQRYADIDARTKAHEEAIEASRRQNAQTLITQAKTNFQREHKLSQQDTDRVFNASLSMYNL